MGAPSSLTTSRTLTITWSHRCVAPVRSFQARPRHRSLGCPVIPRPRSGRPRARRGICPDRPGAQVAAPAQPLPPAWPRSRRAATVAGQSGSRPACAGSSGSSRHGAACPVRLWCPIWRACRSTDRSREPWLTQRCCSTSWPAMSRVTCTPSRPGAGPDILQLCDARDGKAAHRPRHRPGRSRRGCAPRLPRRLGGCKHAAR